MWSSFNRLTPNCNKCMLLSFSRSTEIEFIVITGCELDRVTYIKDLRVTFESHFTFTKHNGIVNSTAFNILGVIKRSEME